MKINSCLNIQEIRMAEKCQQKNSKKDGREGKEIDEQLHISNIIYQIVLSHSYYIVDFLVR